MEWNTVSGVITAFPLLSLVAFVQLPESPVLLVKNRIREADRALWWLRGEGGGIQVRGMGQRCGLCVASADPRTIVINLTFRRRIKSRLPFAGIIRNLPYSTLYQDTG